MSSLKHCLSISKHPKATEEFKAELLAEQAAALKKGLKNPMYAGPWVLSERLKAVDADLHKVRKVILAYYDNMVKEARAADQPVYDPDARPKEPPKKKPLDVPPKPKKGEPEFRLRQRVVFSEWQRGIIDLKGKIDKIYSPTFYKIRGDNGLVYEINIADDPRNKIEALGSKDSRWIEGHLQTQERYDRWWTHLIRAREAAKTAGLTNKDVDWNDLKAIVAMVDAFDNSQIKEPPPEVPKTPELSEKAQQASALADWISEKLTKAEPVSWRELFKKADKIYGGTQAEGAYTPRDAYDGMELGVNRHLLKHFHWVLPDGQRKSPERVIKELQAITDALPTQSKRTKEQIDFQQFSTPPFLAYVANWVAAIGNNDIYLEPSAGIGGLAVFGRMSNAASIYVNELSERRRELLTALNIANETFGEDAIQLDNILPERIKPSVIVMNPPFSSTAGRLAKNFTKYGAQHVEQALKRLEPGGRLVAIVGRGMEMEAPTFRKWWTQIRKQYNVRANVGIDGGEYRKYGTTFDNRLLVIDKTGPTEYDPLVDRVLKVSQLPEILNEVRNDRQAAPKLDTKGQSDTVQPPLSEPPETGEGPPSGPPSTRPESSDLGDQGPKSDVGPGGGEPPGSPQQPPEPPTGPRDQLPGPSQPDSEGQAPGTSESDTGRTPRSGDGEPDLVPPEETPDLSLDEFDDLFDDLVDDLGLSGPQETPPTTVPAPQPGPPAPDSNLPQPPKTPKKPKTPKAPADRDDYDDIADLMNDAGIKEPQAPFEAGKKAPLELVHPSVYAKVKEKFTSAYVKYVSQFKDKAKASREWMRDAIKSMAAKGVNIDVVKNWVKYFYFNDKPTLEEIKDIEIEKAKKEVEDIKESLYQRYVPTVKIKGAKKHPTLLDESAALGDTDPPPPTYKPSLPQSMIDDGKASDAQLEFVVYAGQAHEQMLPNGQRRGIFAGHGTGVGKGRIIASIFLDNWNKGRKKAIWISEKWPLFNDAKRDLGYDKSRKAESGIGWQEGADKLFPLNVRVGEKVKQSEGIMFTTYSTLRSNYSEINEQNPSTLSDLRIRINQIVDWAGADYDGVIAFDESHNMSNSLEVQTERGTAKASAMAKAGIMLQNRLPNARIVYVSATGATEVRNLAYAERLGLWGDGTAFPRKTSFITDINNKGLAAMELVARDLKARGLYLAPTLSYDGVRHDKLVHVLDDQQRAKYDELARAWQIVLHNVNEALGLTGQDHDSDSKQGIWSAFWGGQQRFFNQLITTMQMGTAITHMEEQLAAGHSLVLQLVNHGGDQLVRALNARDQDSELEDLEIGPKAALLEYLENGFPTQQWEDYIDEDGNEAVRPVVDSQGNPVVNREAEAMKRDLIQRISAIQIPGSPLDLILHHFGADQVAEVTGRKRRLVYDKDTGELVEEKWSDSKSAKDVEAFMDDEKRILVFSEKGGTGMSYHADLDRKNQRKRIHYLVQPGWRADKAIQGLGRTHRSNQLQPPEYYLLTTDLDAQRRFISSIARRLDQLGSLTKGQRQTGSQGIFDARDNMESEYAQAALSQLYRSIVDGTSSISIQEFEDQTALSLVSPTTGEMLKSLPPPTKFMNRLLTMEIRWQNRMFGEWSQLINAIVDAAAAAGTLDVGIETVKALSIVKVEDRTVNTDEPTGAKTRYVRLEVSTPSNRKTFEDLVNVVKYYVNVRSQKIWGASPERTRTNSSGNVEAYRSLVSPAGSVQPVLVEALDTELQMTQGERPKWTEITKEKRAAELWNAAYAETPATTTRDSHLMTGALLPIWDRLTGASNVHRMQTDEGERFLGLVIRANHIDAVLESLGAGREARDYTGKELAKDIMDDNATVRLAKRWKMKRKIVSGDERIELFGPDYDDLQSLQDWGVFVETIAHKTRYFVPTGKNAAGVIDRIIANKPVVDVVKPYAGPRLSDTVVSEPSDLNKAFGSKKQVQMNMFGGNQLNLFTDLKPSKPKGPKLPQSRQTVEMETTGDISHYGTKINNSAEAAGLVSFLLRKGAEEAYTIAVDADNNVIQIHRVSKGASGSASVPPTETGGTLLRAAGATQVYFIHQHPSGFPAPSPEDINIGRILGSIAELRGIKVQMVIMANNPARYIEFNATAPDLQGSLQAAAEKPLTAEIKKRVKANLNTKLPVSERFITPLRGIDTSIDQSVNNSVEFRKLMTDQYHDMEGALLLSAKNVDMGFVPWEKGITQSEYAARMISEAERHNAPAIIFNIRTPNMDGNMPITKTDYLRNLVKGLTEASLTVHDIQIDGVSMADKGLLAKWKREFENELSKGLKNLVSDAVLFSRKVAKPKVPMTADSVRKNIDPYLSEMSVKPPVTVVARQNALPEGVRKFLLEQGGPNDIVVAAVHDGRVYLVAENIDNRHEAVRALLHEIMGHFGIRAVLGKSFDKTLDSVYAAKRDEIGPIAIEYGFNLRTIEGRRAAADEWLAREAETNPDSKWIDRVIAAIRKWLRSIRPGLKFSDTEIRALLGKARQYIRTGQPTSVFPQIAFDRMPALADMWYSHMAGVIEASLPVSGTGPSYLRALNEMANSGKFKEEELEWSGLREWLKEQKGKIPRETMLTWLAANNVRLKEIQFYTDPAAKAASHLRDNNLDWQPVAGSDNFAATWRNPIDGTEYDFEVRKDWGTGEGVIVWSLFIDSNFKGDWDTAEDAMQIGEDNTEDLKDKAINEMAEIDFYKEGDSTWTATWDNEFNGESLDFEIQQVVDNQGRMSLYEVSEDGESWGMEAGTFNSLAEAKEAVERHLQDGVHDAMMFNDELIGNDIAEERQSYRSEDTPRHDSDWLSTPGERTGYREILLTLPVGPNKAAADRSKRVKALIAKKEKYRALYIRANTSQERQDATHLIENTRRRIDKVMAETDEDSAYYHGHWKGVPNVVAHVRFNERIDSQGRRILYLEEVQSDMHQLAREKGYRGVLPPGHKVIKNDAGRYQIEEPDGTIFGGADSRQEVIDQFAMSDAIPNVPFKGANVWSMLIMKRMVRYAAENDFDLISWTPGAIQNERYSLAKVVDAISWEASGKDTFVTMEGLTGVSNQSLEIAVNRETGMVGTMDIGAPEEWKGKHLSDLVGKEHTKNILGKDKGRIEGEGLKVGGAGMIKFYDQMLPNNLNKFFGKAPWGKAKVEVGNIVQNKGLPAWTVYTAEGDPWARLMYEGMAKVKAEEIGGRYELEPEKDEGLDVLTLPITPEMKAKALYEGMPLFMLKRHGDIDVLNRLPENVKHRMAQGRGVPKKSWIEDAREKIKFVKSQRYHFPDLYTIGNETEEDKLNDILRRHQEVPETAKDMAARKIAEFTRGLEQDEYEIFRINLILADMVRDIDSKLLTDQRMKEGDTLPFGFKDVQEVRDTFETFEQMANQNPKVRKAINDRRTYIRGIVKEMVKFKILKKEVLKHKDYFHHQVLAYWAGNQVKTIGASSADVRTHWRPWMTARKGSVMDYNTEYVEAEFAAIAQQLAQLGTARTLERVKNVSDIYRDLKTAAKAQNLTNFYKIAARQASVMFGGNITPAEVRADHKLDPLFPYRQNIAMASSQLENMAHKDKLEVDSEWDDVVDQLAENYVIRKSTDEDMIGGEMGVISDARYFAFLSYLIDKRKPGASWAATTFKAIHARNKHIKNTLGDGFLTFRNIIPEGYIQWKPDPSKGWFWANTIADDILQKIIAGEAALQDKDVRKMLAKGQDLIWVIPQGLAVTMDNFRRYPDANSMGRMADWMLAAWKMWILINPRRWVRYNVNNMSGDLDIVLAARPAIANPKAMTQALNDLRKWMKRKELSEGVEAELNMWRANGAIGSGFAVQEVEDILNTISIDKYVRHVLLGEKPNIAMRYWSWAKGSTVLRENMLRLAAARYFKKSLTKGNVEYGASKRHEVDAITDINEKAAKLARELVGDYGNISSAGQYLRKRIMPFYSWMEINLPRYVYLMRNLRSEDRFDDARRVRRQVAGIATKKLAVKGGMLFIKANLLMGAVMLWNMLAHKDEWEELGEAKRRQMHLILGRNDDGTISTIRFQGALSDALSFFGLEDWPADIADVVGKKSTIQEKMIEAPKALLNRAAQAVRPEPKLAFESALGYTAYPDVLNPRPIRDTMEHVLRTFSLDSLYRMAAGKPGRGKNVAEHMLSDIKSLLVYKSDPGEQAYYDTRKTVFDWLGAQGKERYSGKPTKKGNAIYYYRQALKYGDLKAAKRYLEKYYEFKGTTGKTLRGSIKRAHPLSSIPLAKRYRFRKTLDPGQQERLKMALKWYDETYKTADREFRHPAPKKTLVNQ